MSRLALGLVMVLVVVAVAGVIDLLLRPLLPVVVVGLAVLAVYKLMLLRRW